ncbi:acyl-CoA dehydrogenase family protein [Arvimicrobium flavum]|uniref:acyl-CoA dehydrogenase family protein n=1 Tax=Arvimicrobium flavum TaxID=3393320 RepID=UPI00237BFD48|nr:acyl-CoA dehydrogenase [Mesorhizobium shangrilense]
MDLRLNEQQVMLRESAHRFLREEYHFDARRADLADQSPGKWAQIGHLGWPGASLPEETGGLGGSAVEFAILMEEMGKALYVGPFLSTAMVAAMLRVLPGTDAAALLARIARGEARAAFAHGEPGGRGFFDAPRAVATREGDRFVIRGGKRLVYDLVAADIVLVSAAAPSGTAILLLEPPKSSSRRDYANIDNSRASDLELEGASAALLAEGETAARMLDEAFYWASVGLGAEAVGIADHALKHTMEYVAVRKQFGKALAEFQVIQHRISDMFVEIEQLRSLLLYALSMQEAAPDERRRAALGLKILAGQVATKVAGDGLHLHGGMGMTDEMPISHYYRRARVLDAQLGNGDYLLGRHSRMLA